MNQPPGGYGPPPGGGYGPPPGGYGGPPSGGPPPGGGGYGGPPSGGYGGPPGGYGPPPGYPPPSGMPPGGVPLGGYPPPGMAPMPPPPPKKGMSGATIAMIVIGILLLFMGSCTAVVCVFVKRAKDSVEAAVTSEPAPKPLPAPKPVVNDNWITAERPYIKFLAPAGWTTQITDNKEWGIFRSPKKDAVLTFTTFNRPGESTVRLGKAANVLGVTDINWNTPGYTTVGKDKFEAHAANGTCNFEGPGGFIWYATVNTGSSDQILLIFAVASNAPRARRAEAQGAIDTLQRR